MECEIYKVTLCFIFVMAFVVSVSYFISRDIRLFFDKRLFYKNRKLFLMEGRFDEMVYVIVLEEISDETILVKQYDNFVINNKIVKKSNLISIKES